MASPSGRSPANTLRSRLLPCLAVALCYANSLRVPFLLDDPRPGTPLSYARRPLVAASFALNRALSGDATWSFHLFNVLVHLGCGFLLLEVLRRALARAAPSLAARTHDDLALVATLLWLCHPLQTAAVTYLSQRAESMTAFFTLALLYTFQRSTSSARPRSWSALTFLALLLGFATKEIFATAPVLLLLYDALFLAAGPLAALRARWRFHGALALATLGLALVFTFPVVFLGTDKGAGFVNTFAPLEYARTQPGVLLHYLRLVFWPHPLCFDYGWPIATQARAYLPQSLALAVLLGATLVACWRRSWIGFAGASFFVILAPTSSFIPINDPAFEHRMYLPLAAVLVLVVVGAWQLAARSSLAARRALPVLAGAAIVVCGGLTVRRNHDYRSRLALAEATVACAPHHGRAHGDLGAALDEAGRTEEALPEMLEALRLDPTLTYTYLNVGAVYFRLGHPEQGRPYFERAVQLKPDANSLGALGYALFLQGDAEGAARRFEQAIAAGPDEARLHQRLAAALAQLGRMPEAIESYREALRRAPDLQEAHLGLAQLLRAGGKVSEALEHVQAALAFPPDSADERFTAGQVFRALGRMGEAEQAFLAASQLAPELAEPRMAYAETVCQEPGAGREKLERARAEARRANELARGSRPEVLGVLALVEAACGDFERAVAAVDEALRLPGLAQRTEQQLQAQRAELLRRAGGR